MSTPSKATADLDTLVGLFYPRASDWGASEEVEADAMPEPYRRLLAHNEHMTVTVESFHGSPVDVEVLEKRVTPSHYARKILLRRQSDGRVVQYGIVRLNFDYLSPEVRREIESEGTPLGRVLIQHNVLREVQLVSLWKITPGPDLVQLFELADPADARNADSEAVFGRTALIYCNGEPAVELLEIVTPE